MQENIKWFNDRGYGVRFNVTPYNGNHVLSLMVFTMRNTHGPWTIRIELCPKEFIEDWGMHLDTLFNNMRESREWTDIR